VAYLPVHIQFKEAMISFSILDSPQPLLLATPQAVKLSFKS